MNVGVPLDRQDQRGIIVDGQRLPQGAIRIQNAQAPGLTFGNRGAFEKHRESVIDSEQSDLVRPNPGSDDLDRRVQRDEWRDTQRGVGGCEIIGQGLPKGSRGHNRVVDSAQSTQGQPAKASFDGIAYQKRACQDRSRNSRAENHREVDAPVMGQTSKHCPSRSSNRLDIR